MLLLREHHTLDKRLHWCLAVAPAALMRALRVVRLEKGVEVRLHRVQRAIQLLAKRHSIKLVEQRLVEALTNPVGLRALGFGA